MMADSATYASIETTYRTHCCEEEAANRSLLSDWTPDLGGNIVG